VSLTAIITFVIGCLTGGVVAWLVVSSRARGAEAINLELRQSIEKRETELNTIRSERDSERLLNAKLEESHKHLKEDIHQFEEIEIKLVDKFKALSLDALSANSLEFIKLAEERLKSQTIEGEKELDNKKNLIDKNIEVIVRTLTDMQKKIDDVGKGSLEVSTLIKKHEEVTSKLKDTTDHLRQAFASSKKRGEWGERMAEDIMKLVGMVEGINYIKQKTLEDATTRPDYTFLMPNNLKINMDVKFPLENYRHYLDAVSEHDKKRFKDELIKNAKVMIKQVTTRDYIDPSKNTVDYVIVFITNEQVYSFINEADITLMDEALKKKVVLCSPFTLYAMLAVIRQGIENFNLEQTASEILSLLGEFSKQWNAWKDKFSMMGKKLDDARKEYDSLLSTRSTMLERPLKKIDLLREQRNISFNSESTDDNGLPR
jgi:DNA recombination protein RmuC